MILTRRQACIGVASTLLNPRVYAQSAAPVPEATEAQAVALLVPAKTGKRDRLIFNAELSPNDALGLNDLATDLDAAQHLPTHPNKTAFWLSFPLHVEQMDNGRSGPAAAGVLITRADKKRKPVFVTPELLLSLMKKNGFDPKRHSQVVVLNSRAAAGDELGRINPRGSDYSDRLAALLPDTQVVVPLGPWIIRPEHKHGKAEAWKAEDGQTNTFSELDWTEGPNAFHLAAKPSSATSKP